LVAQSELNAERAEVRNRRDNGADNERTMASKRRLSMDAHSRVRRLQNIE
jgi:hypothetical protein